MAKAQTHPWVHNEQRRESLCLSYFDSTSTTGAAFRLRAASWLLRWDDYGGGYFVVGVEVEEFYALGAAACGADGLGVDADDLAELADDHHLAGLVDEVDAGDLAVLGRGLDVDDALAAAGLEAVLDRRRCACRSRAR